MIVSPGKSGKSDAPESEAIKPLSISNETSPPLFEL